MFWDFEEIFSGNCKNTFFPQKYVQIILKYTYAKLIVYVCSRL